MEEFIDYAKVIMGVLGHKLFEPIRLASATEILVTKSDDTNMLYLERTIKNSGKVEACGEQTTEGFVVMKDSRISPADDDTIPAAIKEQRKKATVD